MLESLYVGLRLAHFMALMLATGVVLYGAWWAASPLRRLILRRFRLLLTGSLGVSAVAATLMLMLQGGLMGNGWQDVLRPSLWLAVAETRFGSVWIWQILLAWVALLTAALRPQRSAALLLTLCVAQFVLLAGVGHAAMHDGLLGAAQRVNHAVHLLCATAWFGGLLPFLYCLRLASGQWRKAAIFSMMRFSRYGHLAVAGVIITGIANALFIQGTLFSDGAYGRLLLVKSLLVALMVAIALLNRYVLVPRLSRTQTWAAQGFVRTTQAELVLGALVLALVSLFATWEPF